MHLTFREQSLRQKWNTISSEIKIFFSTTECTLCWYFLCKLMENLEIKIAPLYQVLENEEKKSIYTSNDSLQDQYRLERTIRSSAFTIIILAASNLYWNPFYFITTQTNKEKKRRENYRFDCDAFHVHIMCVLEWLALWLSLFR